MHNKLFLPPFPEKTEDSVRVISVNWNRFLSKLGTGINVASVVWDVKPSGLTLSGAALSANVATVKVSGGTKNTRYTLSCKATMDDANAQVEERHGFLTVVDHKRIR